MYGNKTRGFYNMTNTITIKDIREYVSTIADDIMNEREHWSEDDLQDIISEHADGSQFVIYYSQAHDFVHALDYETRNDAEERAEDYMFGTRKTYDEMASILAYCALELLISDELSARLDRDKAA
jgi:hypothetical protein